VDAKNKRQRNPEEFPEVCDGQRNEQVAVPDWIPSVVRYCYFASSVQRRLSQRRTNDKKRHWFTNSGNPLLFDQKDKNNYLCEIYALPLRLLHDDYFKLHRILHSGRGRVEGSNQAVRGGLPALAEAADLLSSRQLHHDLWVCSDFRKRRLVYERALPIGDVLLRSKLHDVPNS